MSIRDSGERIVFETSVVHCETYPCGRCGE